MFARFAKKLRCLAFVIVPAIYGQGNYATVTGIVTDSLQAVTPGANISVRNVDTDIKRSVLTSASGDYTITNLAPGPYELTAEMQGFHTFRKTAIVLQIGQTLRVDVQLEVGAVTESVSVTAEVATLNTESGTIKGDVIVQQEIQDLPLEGRDFTDLAFLVPGVVPTAQGGQGAFASINGARSDSTNFYVDGFNNRNPRGAAAQVRPNMNAMQEFKMEVSGYSAEYGRMAGGILNMVLGSGTNQYHGDFFEYVRNNVIDARAFFDPEKLKLNRHNYGATFHGPVWLPKIYDGHSRTFFMFSWESFKQLVGTTALSHVPTTLEQSGDFAGSMSQLGKPVTVTDPFAKNAPFPDNRIPASRFHPAAVKLMAYYPAPNRFGRNNYVTVANDNDAWDSFMVKLDHRFDEKNSIAYRYQIRFNNTSAPFAGGDLGIFGNKIKDDRSLMGIDFTHLFTPTFLVEYHGGYSRNTSHERTVWSGRDIAAELGIPGTTREPELIGFPTFTVLDYVQIGTANNEPVQYHVTDIQNGIKFTWVRSHHVMKWGFDHSRVRFNQPYFNNNRGTFAFQDRWTGHPIGDVLLGMLNSTSRTVGWNRNYMRATSMGAYFNDDFKLRPNLTLNLGVRYEIDLPPYDRYDRMSNFIAGIQKIAVPNLDLPGLADTVAAAGLQGRMVTAAAAGLPPSLVFGDYNNAGPRFGFAWRPRNTHKMVVRGGYGIFYTGHVLNPIRNSLQNAFPFVVTESYSRNANRTDLLTLSNPFPMERISLGGINSSNGYDEHAPAGYLQSYNLTMERDIGGGMALEIGFVGSKGTHLGRQYDINIPHRSMDAYLKGIPNAQLRRFPFLNGAINYYTFGVNSIYHAGQISLRKRGRGGMFYRLNYSYAKSIDNASQITGTSDGGFGGAQNPDDFKAERARSDWDRGHVVTAAFSWPVPFGSGRRFLHSARGWSQGVMGGWQLSGTTSFATGAPLTVTSADVDLNLGESQRPNRLATGIPNGVPGGKRGVDYPWFVLADFEKAPRCASVTEGCGPSPHGFLPFHFGNSGRNILDGPGYAYTNLALMKNFRFQDRKNFQLRFESFNVVNHPNFRLPAHNFNTTTAGLIDGVAATGRGGPRVFQASLKFEF
jgi:hypothetical protein